MRNDATGVLLQGGAGPGVGAVADRPERRRNASRSRGRTSRSRVGHPVPGHDSARVPRGGPGIAGRHALGGFRQDRGIQFLVRQGAVSAICRNRSGETASFTGSHPGQLAGDISQIVPGALHSPGERGEYPSSAFRWTKAPAKRIAVPAEQTVFPHGCEFAAKFRRFHAAAAFPEAVLERDGCQLPCKIDGALDMSAAEAAAALAESVEEQRQ